MRGLFFTGTDTGVGKTFVTAAVARVLQESRRPVRVSKPVATGGDDTRRLAEAVGASGAELQAITPWVLAAPAAPAVAARLAGVRLTLDDLLVAVRRQARPETMLLVEGVGGLLCPLTETETVADLVRELRLPLIVVARRSLGTLNHTLLTVEAAHRRGLTVAGVVVSETVPPAGVADETNVEELRRRLDVPVLAVVTHGDVRPVVNVDWWALGSE